VTSLAQVLLELTSPGVPDLYQGTELWDLSLVDPDNRRPVDFEHRRRALAALEGMSPEAVMERAEEGLPKLWLIRNALWLRRRRPRAFGPDGDYRPLWAGGSRAEHVVAFERGGEVVTVVPRLVLKLGGEWADTALALPPGAWRNVLTDERVEGGEARLADLLRRFPVALLAREETSP
jgi:(1->4)-alpha-D-glucan 1-alpha-D-glucosylmutase